MSQPVTIENDSILMQVWPSFGGKVSSIIDKADKFDLMFNYPAELPTAAEYDEPFDNSWHAGWVECFPAIAAGRYPGHPYDGIGIPDHGELWGLPTTAVPTKDGITTVWHGLRFGYRLTRKLQLQQNSLVAEYTLINLAPFEFHFIWAQHALMSMNSAVQIELANGGEFLSHDAETPSFEWPRLQDVNLSQIEKLPPQKCWKVFSKQRIESPLIVRYPTRGRSVTMEYESSEAVNAYWGIWINTGGWGRHKDFAIEPMTGRFDDLERAMKDGSAGEIGPLGRREWIVKWTLGS